MKKIILFGMCLTGVGVFGIAAGARDAHAQGKGSALGSIGQIGPIGPIGSIGRGEPVSQLGVYRFSRGPGSDPGLGKQLMDRFMNQSEMANVHRSDEGVLFFASPKDENDTFEQNLATGDIRFRRNMTRYLGDFAPKLPSGDEAQEIALRFLKENDLLPKDMGQLKLAHVGGLRATSVIDGDKPGPIIDKLVTLSYSRMVDGLPVLGPGSKLVLDIGEGGEIVGLVRHWREIEPMNRKGIGAEDLISPREALARANKQIREQFGEKSFVKIAQTGRAYFDNNGGIMQPVYYYQAQITLPDQRRFDRPIEYVAVVPMLRASPEPLDLTALDPRAKEMIRTIKQNEPPPSQQLPTD
jgi:hypothetical protein